MKIRIEELRDYLL